MALLVVQGLVKTFTHPDGSRTPVVAVSAFSLEAGALCGLRGPSGCGKTTFLNLVSGIVRPDRGVVSLDGVDLAKLGEADRDVVRGQSIGCLFQTFNLLQGFSALENVEMAMRFGGGVDSVRARGLLERVGLAGRLAHRPHQLSVGQQQRVAVARALANRPKLVLADEPTGSLDPASAREALALIRGVCHEQGAALLLVSHDASVLAGFDRVEDFAALNRMGMGVVA